jgi:hypothetical protein
MKLLDVFQGQRVEVRLRLLMFMKVLARLSQDALDIRSAVAIGLRANLLTRMQAVSSSMRYHR